MKYHNHYRIARETALSSCGSLFNRKKLKDIPYPKERSEAEIQAMLWQKLRSVKFVDPRLEVCADFDTNRGFKTVARARFDIVVYTHIGGNTKAVAIIEVKRDSVSNDKFSGNKSKSLNSKKQIENYAQFEPETLFCIGSKDIDVVFNAVMKLCRASV